MTPDEARLYALLTLHGLLLNQVWAQRLMTDPRPFEAEERMRAQLSRMLDRTTMPAGADPADMELIRAHLLSEGERFMDGVLARLAEVLRPAAPRPGD